MDINNITLSPVTLVNLYPLSLVKLEKKEDEIPQAISIETKPVNPEALKASPMVFKSLGGNEKNILVVVDNSNVVHLPDEDLAFLTDILNACKLSIADIAVVNINSKPEATYKELSAAFRSRIILLFDADPVRFGLPMSFPHFQIQPFAANSFLYAPALAQLSADKILKSKLWVCLRRLFNI